MYDWAGRCHSLCKCPSVYEETPPVTSTLDSRLRRNDALEISFRLFACPSVPRPPPRPSLDNHAVAGRSLVRQYPSANGSDCSRWSKMIGDAFDRTSVLSALVRGSLSFHPFFFVFFVAGIKVQNRDARRTMSSEISLQAQSCKILLTIILSSCSSSKS